MEKDKVDQAALGFDYKGETEKHQSQKGAHKPPVNSWDFLLFLASSYGCPCLDYSKGFGGKFGVEREKVDKAALGYDYKAETEKHQSQKGARTLAPAYNGSQC